MAEQTAPKVNEGTKQDKAAPKVNEGKLRELYGPTVNVLQSGENTVVIEYVEKVKDEESGVTRDCKRVQKVPLP